jgi:hypothetical protein
MFRVWKDLWPALGSVVLELYQASLDLKYVSQWWRTAKIVVLCKPNKPDYSKPKAYRPISLLQTISKGLKAVIAKRLSYLAETYILFSENQFGGRPNRSAEQALDLLVEKRHEAWRADRVLSLVSFDVQGAFNGVYLLMLADRLRERRVPGNLVAWIESFCNGRRASVVVAALVPTTDYAASIWYAPSRIGVKRQVVALERAQQLASRMILQAYKSVAMLVLQSEAKLQSVSDSLHERVPNPLAKLCSMASDHLL